MPLLENIYVIKLLGFCLGSPLRLIGQCDPNTLIRVI